MKVPVWVHETTACFWQAAGASEPFPRTLRGPIRRGPFELTVKEWPGLSTSTAERYLALLGPGWACGGSDRAVRACLAARDGAGFILLDADDTDAERTFSLAHELAHFLWHYWHPRQAASRRLGWGVVGVFDGKRPPTPAERVGALLAGLPLGPHVHLMERGPGRRPPTPAVASAEEEADRLAYELLAPAASIAALLPGTLSEERRPELERLLRETFGLPAERAEDYGRLLVPPAPVDPLVLRLWK